jgi:hypothetical protein
MARLLRVITLKQAQQYNPLVVGIWKFVENFCVPILFIGNKSREVTTMTTDNNDRMLKTIKTNMLQQVNLGNKRTHTFKVDFSEYDPSFVGEFNVHYPSQMELIQVGLTKSALLGGGTLVVDTYTENIAIFIATLDVVINKQPEWFNLADPSIEYDMLQAIYDEYMNWVNTFRNRAKPDNNEGDSPDGRSQVSVVDTEDVSHISD